MEIKNIPKYLILLLTLGFLLNPLINANAKQYALLVGISDYHIQPLAGPINDVNAMRDVLIRQWGFKKNNITLLINKGATKSIILNTLESLYTNSNSDDSFFIYFSGHGTSALDSDIDIGFALPITSGAFLPYDINQVKNMAQVEQALIIGRRDLKPIFSKFDKGGRHMFVTVDACYSGNLVRGVKNTLPNRYRSLAEFSASLNPIRKMRKPNNGNKPNTEPYPYKTIYFLSASGEHEPAQDIPAHLISKYPTIDGKPHGAFTDTLLRILNGEIPSDLNGDGGISYAELKQVLRNAIRRRGFSHTPSSLPSLREDKFNLSAKLLFSGFIKAEKINLPTQKTPSLQPLQSLQPVIDNPYLSAAIVKDADVRLVQENPNLRLSKKGLTWQLQNNNGEILFQSKQKDPKNLTKLIQHQAKLDQLLSNNLRQDFTLEFDFYQSGKGSSLTEGESLGFTVRSRETAQLLLLNYDSQGFIHVIYPATDEELKPIQQNSILMLPDISTIQAPLGREVLQLYAFTEPQEKLKQLKGKSFDENSSLMTVLNKLIKTKSRKASSLLEVYTSSKI